MPRFRACLLLFLVLAAGFARAGMNEDTKYTEKGQADFDTFLQILNPYGTWVEGRRSSGPTHRVDHQPLLHQRTLGLYRIRLAVEGHAAP